MGPWVWQAGVPQGCLTIELHVLLLLGADQSHLQQLSCTDEQIILPGQVAKARSWPHVPTQSCDSPAPIQHAAEFFKMLGHKVYLGVEMKWREEAGCRARVWGGGKDWGR